jgi:hypothetical protein
MMPLLYTAELDLADPDIAPFLDWYAYRHVPDLFPLGFQSCACYRTLGGDMNLFDIYEIPDHAVFTHPGYRRMNERDRYAPPLLAKRRQKAHTIYRQIALGGHADSPEPSLDADWIAVFRFETPAEPDAIASTFAGPAWRGRGITRARLGVRTQDHPTYTTHRPSFMLVLECDEDPSEINLVTSAAKAIPSSTSNVDQFSARRVFPWPTK